MHGIINGYQLKLGRVKYMREEIFLYYTNDLHSNFSQWPKVSTYLKRKKEEKRTKNQTCFLLDIGDHMDRVNPITEATLGKANVQLLNEVGYDLVTLGNNEGITLSHEDLAQLYDQASFDIVCANLESRTKEEPAWLQPSITIETIKGVRVGFIGLTAPFNDFYHLLDWHVEFAFSTLDKHIPILQESTDIIVLLSHLGINEDRQIARRYDEIDVIVGGHTHHLLEKEEIVDQTIITAAGKGCEYVGEVLLVWDHEQNKLIKRQARTKNITKLSENISTKQCIEEAEKEADHILNEPVIWLDKSLKIDWFKNTAIMQTLTDMMKSWTEADIAMLNAGMLLESLDAGLVTYGDIHRICPHPINPCVVELTGNQIREVVRASLTKEFMELRLKGFGFRGELIGRMIYSGLQVKTRKHQTGHEYVKEIKLNEGNLDPDTYYKVAVADTFTFGRLLPEVAKSAVKKYYLPEFLRDLLRHTLIDHF